MNISAPFVKRPIGTTLLAAGMAVIGVICYFLLGVAALPNMEFPAIFVTANQPGRVRTRWRRRSRRRSSGISVRFPASTR